MKKSELEKVKNELTKEEKGNEIVIKSQPLQSTEQVSEIDFIDKLEKFEKVATKTKNIILKLGWYDPIRTQQGERKYPRFEATSFVALLFNITARVVKITKYDNKVEATAEALHIPTGRIVGMGHGVCSKTERGKENFTEQQLIGLASTRACHRALKQLMSPFISMLGLETTPAEELNEEMKKNIEAEVKAVITIPPGFTLIEKLTGTTWDEYIKKEKLQNASQEEINKRIIQSLKDLKSFILATKSKDLMQYVKEIDELVNR